MSNYSKWFIRIIAEPPNYQNAHHLDWLQIHLEMYLTIQELAIMMICWYAIANWNKNHARLYEVQMLLWENSTKKNAKSSYQYRLLSVNCVAIHLRCEIITVDFPKICFSYLFQVNIYAQWRFIASSIKLLLKYC